MARLWDPAAPRRRPRLLREARAPNEDVPARAVARHTPPGKPVPEAREYPWTLDDIVTAIAGAGVVERRKEHPEQYWPRFAIPAAEFARLPHSLSLIARRRIERYRRLATWLPPASHPRGRLLVDARPVMQALDPSRRAPDWARCTPARRSPRRGQPGSPSRDAGDPTRRAPPLADPAVLARASPGTQSRRKRPGLAREQRLRRGPRCGAPDRSSAKCELPGGAA